MKKIFFSIIVGAFLLGCGGGSGSSQDDNESSLHYSGNLYSCVYKGTSCIDSEYCAVKTATSSTATIECRENLQTVNFSGKISSCYFAGVSCVKSSNCVVKTQAGDIGTIECSK
ncbi:MAG: hypothetical protein LBD41_03475 [Clostridiales Family XIII bacterium]|jgi:hypothetical protein|nr:hypothetical protein [Clostridiales Family XIII bacterium]